MKFTPVISFLALAFVLNCQSVLAQTPNPTATPDACRGIKTKNTCYPNDRVVEITTRRVDFSKERLARAHEAYDLSLQDAAYRRDALIEAARIAAETAHTRCSINHDKAYDTLVCYVSWYYNDCRHKEHLIEQNYDFCNRSAKNRKQTLLNNAEFRYASLLRSAKVRFDHQKFSLESKIKRDQTRLNESQSKLDFCLKCLTP